MRLEVRLFTGLKCNNRELPSFGEDEFLLEVPDGISLAQLYEILNLQKNYTLVNIINGISKPKEWVLKENDRVSIFPPVGGG